MRRKRFRLVVLEISSILVMISVCIDECVVGEDALITMHVRLHHV